MVATHIKETKHCMFCVYLMKITNFFFFSFALECESSEHLFFLLSLQIAKSWTSRGVKTFEKLAANKTLKVALVSYDHFTMSYRVGLYGRYVCISL